MTPRSLFQHRVHFGLIVGVPLIEWKHAIYQPSFLDGFRPLILRSNDFWQRVKREPGKTSG